MDFHVGFGYDYKNFCLMAYSEHRLLKNYTWPTSRQFLRYMDHNGKGAICDRVYWWPMAIYIFYSAEIYIMGSNISNQL